MSEDSLRMEERREGGFVYETFYNKKGELVYSRTYKDPFEESPYIEINYITDPKRFFNQ